jgi:outer membrane protein OmpA-like peptidoglycan-associated protein
VHDGPQAHEAASSINARAFTLGSDIAFARGEHSPGTEGGDRLMAHELAHVVQQSASPALQKPDNSYIQRQADITKAPSGLPCILKTGAGHTPGVDIVFSLGKKTISPQDKVKLDTFAATWVASGASDTVFVDGFASTDGAQSTNWRLSCKRAVAVKDYLVKKGVSSSKIILIAHGESTEFSATDEKKNRRVVVSTLAEPSLPGPPPSVPPQPAPVSLKSIRFTSDHGVLKDNDADWSDSGAVVEPEWITDPFRNKAISQTKNTSLIADITVNSGLPSGKSFDLIGSGINSNDTSFTMTGITSAGADQVVNITADASLPNYVSPLFRYIVWKVRAGGKERLAGFSGPHRIYVTYTTPTGGVTEKRMKWSCEVADWRDTPAGIADDIGPEATSHSHFLLSNYNLTNPWTALAVKGDCGTLSTLMKQSLDILGVTGAEVRFVYPRHSDWTNLWSIQELQNERDAHGNWLIFISGGPNNYEGTCFFNSKWWMGGAGDFRWTALGVLKEWTWPNNSSTGQRQVWRNNQSTPVPYPGGHWGRLIVSVAI